MSDRIASMVTQIRNGCLIGRQFVDLPTSRVNRGVCDVLIREGFAWEAVACEGQPNRFRLYLKYDSVGTSVIGHIGCVSKSGRRVYAGVRGMNLEADGFGILIVSTPHGIVSQFEARRIGVGGEVMVEVW